MQTCKQAHTKFDRHTQCWERGRQGLLQGYLALLMLPIQASSWLCWAARSHIPPAQAGR